MGVTPGNEAFRKVLHDIDVEMVSINPEDARLRDLAEARHPDLVRFFYERNAALLALDEARIRAVCRDWAGYELPEEPELFWPSVHKAITAVTILPRFFRLASKLWLAGRGLGSEDPGDL
jgi:hypothetical protein